MTFKCIIPLFFFKGLKCTLTCSRQFLQASLISWSVWTSSPMFSFTLLAAFSKNWTERHSGLLLAINQQICTIARQNNIHYSLWNKTLQLAHLVKANERILHKWWIAYKTCTSVNFSLLACFLCSENRKGLSIPNYLNPPNSTDIILG